MALLFYIDLPAALLSRWALFLTVRLWLFTRKNSVERPEAYGFWSSWRIWSLLWYSYEFWVSL